MKINHRIKFSIGWGLTMNIYCSAINNYSNLFIIFIIYKTYYYKCQENVYTDKFDQAANSANILYHKI